MILIVHRFRHRYHRIFLIKHYRSCCVCALIAIMDDDCNNSNPAPKGEKSSNVSVTPFSINDILNSKSKDSNHSDDLQDTALDMSKAHKSSEGKSETAASDAKMLNRRIIFSKIHTIVLLVTLIDVFTAKSVFSMPLMSFK